MITSFFRSKNFLNYYYYYSRNAKLLTDKSFARNIKTPEVL